VVKNPASHPVVVNYAIWGGQFHELKRALECPPGKTVKVPGAIGKVTVPAEALTHRPVGKGDDPLEGFAVARPGDILMTVTVRNALPKRDAALGVLLGAAVLVAHTDKPGARPVFAGPYALRPGEEVRVHFLRRARGKAEVEVRGVAVYPGGKRSPIKARSSGVKTAEVELGGE
jgi:hypothetical protein